MFERKSDQRVIATSKVEFAPIYAEQNNQHATAHTKPRYETSLINKFVFLVSS